MTSGCSCSWACFPSCIVVTLHCRLATTVMSGCSCSWSVVSLQFGRRGWQLPVLQCPGDRAHVLESVTPSAPPGITLPLGLTTPNPQYQILSTDWLHLHPPFGVTPVGRPDYTTATRPQIRCSVDVLPCSTNCNTSIVMMTTATTVVV